jgi:hypothetical protein
MTALFISTFAAAALDVFLFAVVQFERRIELH